MSEQDLADDVKVWAPEQVELFRKLLQNVIDNPSEAKFRRLKLSNARIGAVFAAPKARQCFERLGWIVVGDNEALELPPTAELSFIARVLEATLPPPPGELMSITVLKGSLKFKVDLPSNSSLRALSVALEQHASLGRIPHARQRLLIGYPPRLLEEVQPRCAAMTIQELSLKAIKLEDSWEEMVGELRSGRASFETLHQVIGCKQTFSDNQSFLLDSGKAMLKANAAKPTFSLAEQIAATKCFRSLWPHDDLGTREARVAFCVECTHLATPNHILVEDAEHPKAFTLDVDRENMFTSALAQASQASALDLRRPLEVRFRGESAEDAGGPRREFFNEFARAAALSGGPWRMTPSGALTSAPILPGTLSAEQADVFRSCGRICGLAFCQVENAAQEQQMGEGGTLAELLAAVSGPEDGEPEQHSHQKLLLGVPLSNSFLRSVMADPPDSLKDLQSALNANQGESEPDFRGSASFLTQSLEDLNLAGQLTFSCTTPDGGVIDLVPNGRQIMVTNDTKLDWLKATLQHELVNSLADAAQSFRDGVRETAGSAYFVLLSAAELGEEWSGRGDVDDEGIKLWQARAKINPARKQQATWFFELLWDQTFRPARTLVLKFTTGSDRWPVDTSGFTFYIEPMDGGDDLLPRAMTCGNMLQLPNYSSKEILRAGLLKSCEWGTSMELV